MDHSQIDRAAFLNRVDEMASSIVERVRPIRFEVATTPAAIDAVCRLRAQVVLARGWASPSDLPGGVERDEFDDRATHITGWDGETLVATSRLVVPEPGKLLPTEKHFDVEHDQGDPAANLDRMAVAHGYHDQRHRIFVTLASASWLELRTRGYHRFLGDITPGINRLYRQVGWTVTVLGEPREYWGEVRVPARFDPFENASIPRLAYQGTFESTTT
jgi:N-acyl-L-homoserine lactone synthetase